MQADEKLRTLKTSFIWDCFRKVYAQTCRIILWNWWKLLNTNNCSQYYLISTLTYKACSLFQTIYKIHQLCSRNIFLCVSQISLQHCSAPGRGYNFKTLIALHFCREQENISINKTTLIKPPTLSRQLIIHSLHTFFWCKFSTLNFFLKSGLLSALRIRGKNLTHLASKCIKVQNERKIFL